MNTHNISSVKHNLNNSRRELPNIPRNTMDNNNRTSSTVNQNPFHTISTTNSSSTFRSTPSQWMENIGHSLRKQTSNFTDVRKILFLHIILFPYNFHRVEILVIEMNRKIH